jgi:primosomal protein N' (replication factor Y)
MFPDTPLYRIDRDTVRSQKRLEQSLDLINSGVPAILIGTQMLAKGHHFPNVTLVAIINADAGFCSADFKAPERTAQLIVQVAGRAGRAERPGEVWIQTYQPENPILTALIEEGYQGFARREMAARQAAGLPPFRPMALLRAESQDPKKALGFLETAKQTIRSRDGEGVETLGPAEAPIPKVADRYRYQLLVLADTRAALHRVLRAGADFQSAARNLRWSLDIDPYDTF